MNTAPVVGLFAGALLVAGAYWLGYDHGADRYRQLVAVHRAQAEEALELAEQAAEQLDGAMRALGLTEQRVKDVLRKKTAGRVCLDPAVVDILRDLSQRPPDAGSLVEDSRVGQRSRPTAEPSDNRPSASDSDVAQWSAQVISRYEMCRAQLSAVRSATNR